MVSEALDHSGRHLLESGMVNTKVKEVLTRYFYEQTRRRPMIVPVAIEV